MVSIVTDNKECTCNHRVATRCPRHNRNKLVADFNQSQTTTLCVIIKKLCTLKTWLVTPNLRHTGHPYSKIGVDVI